MYVFFCGNKTGRQPDNLSSRKKAWESPAVAKVVLVPRCLVPGGLTPASAFGKQCNRFTKIAFSSNE